MKYIVFFLISFSFSSFAASFDCTKATTQHEKLICSDQKLNDADTYWRSIILLGNNNDYQISSFVSIE